MNTSVEINGIIYNVGDKLNWLDTKSDHLEHTGIIKFGIYVDDESYSTEEHIGYYVEYEWPDFDPRYYKEDCHYLTRTLIDCIKVYNAKKVE